MLQEMPYFMENKNWYIEKPKTRFTVEYELTKLGKSIPEVVKSFEEYTKSEQSFDPDPYFSYQIMKEAEQSLREDYQKQGLSKEEIEIKIKEWRGNK